LQVAHLHRGERGERVLARRGDLVRARVVLRDLRDEDEAGDEHERGEERIEREDEAGAQPLLYTAPGVVRNHACPPALARCLRHHLLLHTSTLSVSSWSW